MRLIGKPLKLLRQSLGITAKQAAEIIGVTQQHYLSCEKGRSPLIEKRTKILLDHFGITAPEAAEFVRDIEEIEKRKGGNN